jgi:hypothetical protein
MSTHANSYKIWIRRKSSHIERIQKDIPEYLARSKKYVGSYFESKTSQVIGSGLTEGEKKLLLPDIIGVSPDEREWKAKSILFFQELATEVPFGDGLKLEIGLEKDNNKPLSENNMPLNIMDYVRYRHIKGHPKVAPSEDDAKGDLLKDFFIYNPQKSRDLANKIAADRDNANAKYLTIKNKPEVVSALLIYYGKNPDLYGTDGDRTTELSNLVIENPEIMLTAMADDSLIKRTTLRAMVSYGVVVVIDSAYYTKEKVKIGNNENEAVTWLSDTEKNGNTTSLLVGLLQEAKKKNKAR